MNPSPSVPAICTQSEHTTHNAVECQILPEWPNGEQAFFRLWRRGTWTTPLFLAISAVHNHRSMRPYTRPDMPTAQERLRPSQPGRRSHRLHFL
jgi:hypothetical protein